MVLCFYLSIATVKCPKFEFQNLCGGYVFKHVIFHIIFCVVMHVPVTNHFKECSFIFLFNVCSPTFLVFFLDNDMDLPLFNCKFLQISAQIVLRVLQCHGIALSKALFTYFNESYFFHFMEIFYGAKT